jgi:guanylate kinase
VTPRIVILSAPSGGGKTTINEALRARRADIGYSVSATTRQPRAGEVDGKAYHFVTRAEFDRLIAAGEFLEWAEYAGNRYGTLKREVDAVLKAGRHVLLDIEVQGADQVWKKSEAPRPIRIFILPPSGKGWMERLRGRETESSESLMRRAQWAIKEIQQAIGWEHIIINDDLERAVGEVSEIIDDGGAKQHRPSIQDLRRLVIEMMEEAARTQKLSTGEH